MTACDLEKSFTFHNTTATAIVTAAAAAATTTILWLSRFCPGLLG